MSYEGNLNTIEATGTAPSSLVAFEYINTEQADHYGGKGIGLARLAQNGIAVPPGAVLDADVHRKYMQTGLLPESTVEDIMQLVGRLGGRVALRSSATVEDGESASMAGVFDTHYVTDPARDTVQELLESMYRQASSIEASESVAQFGVDHRNIALAVVVQKLVSEPTHAGVIYAAAEEPQATIQYVRGYGSRLVDGETAGTSLAIDKATRGITHSSGYDAHPLAQIPLASLLDEVDKVTRLSSGHRDIEFAIDPHGAVHILQDRPLPRATAPSVAERTLIEMTQDAQDRAAEVMTSEMCELGTERSILSLANFSELLPHPTAMDVGVFSYIFPGYRGQAGAIQIGRREMGYPLGEASVGYMHYIGGRVYESLARDAATYYAGFPETEQEYIQTLITRYLDAAHEDSSRTQYPEMGLYLQDPTPADLTVLYGAERAHALMQRYQEFTSNLGRLADEFLGTFDTQQRAGIERFIATKREEPLDELSGVQLAESFSEILEHLRLDSCIAFVKAARLGFYYTQRVKSLLSEATSLEGNELLSAISHLSQGLVGSRITDNNLALVDAPDDEQAAILASSLVSHYPAEGEALELRHPRFGDSPESAAEYVAGLRSGRSYRQTYEHQRREREEFQQSVLRNVPGNVRAKLETAITNMQRYMAMRETVKDMFTQEYALLRDRLVAIAARAELQGNSIFHLYPDEILPMLGNSGGMKHLVRARAAEFSRFGELVMPRVLTNHTIDQIGRDEDDDTPFSRADGGLIAPGESFDGIVVNLEEFNNLEDVRAVIDRLVASGKQVVLVARQLNLTHDPYVNSAAGLILENAGFVSHGAQRAREMGVGALSGIRTRKLITGMPVHFDTQTRSVSRIAEQDD